MLRLFFKPSPSGEGAQCAHWAGVGSIKFLHTKFERPHIRHSFAVPPSPQGEGFFYAKVAAMTALMVCIRFSASSKTMDASLSKTSSVTSMQSMPNLS